MYACDRCDDDHKVTTDADGYGLAFCPKVGTKLVSTPN
jgi:hypothetical protein